MANEVKGKLSVVDGSYAWNKKGSEKIFKLKFLDEKGERTKKLKVNFVKGEATVKVALNGNLTDQNNPRYPWMESLAIQGNI